VTIVRVVAVHDSFCMRGKDRGGEEETGEAHRRVIIRSPQTRETEMNLNPE
jgi:hypothetical protein